MMMTKFVAVVMLAFANIQGFRVPREMASRKCGSKGRSAANLEGPNVSIVNGNPAKKCEWIWQVSLEVPGRNHFCGGTLIDPKWVLTAAHCYGMPIDVRVGKYNYRTNDGQVIKVKREILHPDWKKLTREDHDIALLELDKPAKLGSCVGLACLPRREVQGGTKCWTTGWGVLGFCPDGGCKVPDRLQEGQVDTIARRDCVKPKTNYSSRDITDAMVCAQGRKNGNVVDACQGDSGGPLVCESGGTWTVYGATSWGSGCAEKQHPGVWASAYNVLSWIERTMSGGGSPPRRRSRPSPRRRSRPSPRRRSSWPHRRREGPHRRRRIW